MLKETQCFENHEEPDEIIVTFYLPEWSNRKNETDVIVNKD